MMDSIDCSQHPKEVPSHFAISGIGPTVGYIGAAGLAILAALLQYLCTYDPRRDPLPERSEETDGFVPNPVDVILLQRVRSIGRMILFWRKPSQNQSRGYANRFELFLCKFTRVNSDLQLLAGFSLLISGYVQLHDGLQNFHWVLLAVLSYFCAISNQAYLTSRRSSSQKQNDRAAWRLPIMVIFTILVIVSTVLSLNATYPKAHWDRGSWDPQPAASDFAICTLAPRHNFHRAAIADMVLLFSLLFLGLFVRLCRLYSVGRGVRGRLGRMGREGRHRILRLLHDQCCVGKSARSITRLFLYRPILSSFLVIGLLVDIVSSTFFDWVWLLSAFSYGVYQVVCLRPGTYLKKDEWTFGQIIPLVLLAAPLIVTLELILGGICVFYPSKLTNCTKSSVVKKSPVRYGSPTAIADDPARNVSPGAHSDMAELDLFILQGPQLTESTMAQDDTPNTESRTDDAELEFTKTAFWLPQLVYLTSAATLSWSIRLVDRAPCTFVYVNFNALWNSWLRSLWYELPLFIIQLIVFVMLSLLIESWRVAQEVNIGEENAENAEATDRWRVSVNPLHGVNFFMSLLFLVARGPGDYGFWDPEDGSAMFTAVVYVGACFLWKVVHWLKSQR